MNSKAKGNRFELKIANYLKDHGYNARRSAQYCGNSGEAADVVGLPNLHIECKHYQSTAFKYEWLEQAQRDCKDGNLPIVIHKVNGKPVIVTMDLDDFMYLYSNSCLSDGGANG